MSASRIVNCLPIFPARPTCSDRMGSRQAVRRSRFSARSCQGYFPPCSAPRSQASQARSTSCSTKRRSQTFSKRREQAFWSSRRNRPTPPFGKRPRTSLARLGSLRKILVMGDSHGLADRFDQFRCSNRRPAELSRLRAINRSGRGVRALSYRWNDRTPEACSPNAWKSNSCRLEFRSGSWNG